MRKNLHRYLVPALVLGAALQACTGEIGQGPAGPVDEPDPGPADCRLDVDDTLARRLTRYEYQTTVQTILGVDVGAGIEQLPADPRAEGFSNTADALVVSFRHVEAFDSLAETIADGVDWPELLAEYADCTDFTAACESSFIDGVGLRLFRRPVNATERDLYRPLFQAANDEGDDFTVGASLVLRAMLQSPQFLYRLEGQTVADPSSAVRKLDSYEVASRLSYLLWGAAPDESLLAAAATGNVQTDEQIGAQVLRMLKTPQARLTARRYMREWLALDSLDTLTRDAQQYPDWNPQLAADMKEETLSLFDQLVWEEPSDFTDILTAQYTYASEELANLYGFDTPQAGVTKYALDDRPERIGLLTHAGFQTVNGIGNRPSLVARGVFMLYGLMCGQVDAPPAQVDTSMDESLPDQSQRYYSTERLDNKVCVTCHSQFDPLAYAFERYDGIGRYRLEDEHGNPLSQDGWLPASGGQAQRPYQNVAEFAQALSESERVQRCMIEKPLQFALGRPVEHSDTCMLDRVAAATKEGGGQYQAMVLAIALDPTFRLIASETP